MGLNIFTPKTKAKAEEVNTNFDIVLHNSIMAQIEQSIDRSVTRANDGISPFIEAYTDADGRYNSVDKDETTAVFDTNKYKKYEFPDVCVIIEAASVTTASFNINNCSANRIGNTNYWVVSCSTGTDEVKRAQIYRTIYTGSWNGSNINGNASTLTSASSLLVTAVTGLVNIYTSISRDVGFNAYFTQVVFNPSSSTAVNLKTDFTFANTTDNRVSSWVWANRSTNGTTTYQVPIGANIHSGATANTFGTDTSASEKINPANSRHSNVSSGHNHASGIGVLFLYKGDISYVDDANPPNTDILERQKINYASSSIPDLSDISEIEVESTITHTLPTGTFNDAVSSGVVAVKITDKDPNFNVRWKISTEDVIVVIEASSISSVNDFAINDCSINETSPGSWVLRCNLGSVEERRAKIYKTLFYGTDGTNPRASSTYITGITALRTSVARDVGKQAHYAYSADTTNINPGESVGTFVNTTTNFKCSSWSRTFSGEYSNNEIGTNTTLDEYDNPANCKIHYQARWELPSGNILNPAPVPPISNIRGAEVIILSAGGITWNTTGVMTTTFTDFNVDNSIPAFSSISSPILVDDSGWQDFNIDGKTAYAKVSEFTAFTNEVRKLIIEIDKCSISGMGVQLK